MNLVEITFIDVSNRQRKYFDEGKLLDLMDSIELNGLIHAPAVVQATNQLVAGERRLRAMTALHKLNREFTYQGEVVPKGQVPVTFIPYADPIQVKQAELDENLQRQDLSWQERVQAEKELHELRLAESGGEQTLTETAREINAKTGSGGTATALKESIFLAKSLEEDPSLGKIKDKKSAMRVALEKARAKTRAELRESYSVEAETKAKSPHKLIHGDAIEALADWPGQFDLLLTDPPYGMDAGEFNDQFTIAHNYEDSSSGWLELMQRLAEASYNACKPEAHAFVFCHINKWRDLADAFELSGWNVWPRPLIWDKGSLGALPRPQHGPRYCYEALLFANKGNKRVLRTGRDVLSIPNQSKTFHAAEKPVELYVELIERVLEAGEWVVDPFCGSGTIFPAATQSAVRALGVEKELEFYNLAMERMQS